jgi:hypothetical protein
MMASPLLLIDIKKGKTLDNHRKMCIFAIFGKSYS